MLCNFMGIFNVLLQKQLKTVSYFVSPVHMYLHVNHERFQQLFYNEFFIKNGFFVIPRFPKTG